MRRADEILAAYAGQDHHGQRYLLRCLERQPLGLDGALAVEFLHSQEAGAAGDLARLGEATLASRLIADRLRRAGGAPSEEAGQWSRFLARTDELRPPEGAAQLEARGAGALAPLVPGLLAQAKRGGGEARAAARVLGELRVPASLDALRELQGEDRLRPWVLSALASLGGEEAGQVLRQVLLKRENLGVHPWVLVHLRSVPSRESLEFLRGHSGSKEVRPAVAAALEGFDEADTGALFDEICAAGEPWALMHSIESLGRLGTPEATGRLTRIHHHVDHPMVRSACLRALAETGSEAAVAPALASLEDADGAVAATAIEAVVQLPVPVSEYRDRVLALVDAPHPRLTMAATLATMVLEPPRAATRIQEMVQAEDPALLMAAVHCLAYIESPGAPPFLAQVARQAPAGPLRTQAVWALGRRAGHDADAVEPLVSFLDEEGDPEARRRAAWFLAGAAPEARARAAAALRELLSREAEPGVLAACCEALGLLGPEAEGAVPALCEAMAHEDHRVRHAAAWALATSSPSTLDASPAAASDPELGAWDALALWAYRGRGVEELAQRLGKRDGAPARAALDATRQAVHAPALAHRVPGWKGLAEALAAQQDPPALVGRGAPYRPRATAQEEALARHMAGRPGIEPVLRSRPGPSPAAAREAALKVSLFGMAPPTGGTLRVPGPPQPAPAFDEDARRLAGKLARALGLVLLAALAYRLVVVGSPLP